MLSCFSVGIVMEPSIEVAMISPTGEAELISDICVVPVCPPPETYLPPPVFEVEPQFKTVCPERPIRP
jgi:hypothetical protein